MNAFFKKITIVTTIAIAIGYLGIGKSDSLVKSAVGKHDRTCTQNGDRSTEIEPAAIAILSKTLSNLDKTSNTGRGFDYWPNGGIQIAYYHLATFLSYKTLANLSPYPVFLSGPHGELSFNLDSSQTFGHYNPQFLRWFQDHLSQLLEDKRFIEFTRDNFQAYLGNTAQTYWATYTLLNQYPDEFNTLLADYQQRLKNRSVPDGYYYNIAWGENSERYESLKELNASYNPNTIAPAVYFWLRRRLDGTDEQIFSLLEYVLTAYEINQPERVYRDTQQLPIPQR